MDSRKCEKCGEEVDAVKAFCPECGNPFVEEVVREESSEFDNYAGTAQFSKSMFQEMLSDMDLDTSSKKDIELAEPAPEKKSFGTDSKQISLSAIESKKTKPEPVKSSKTWIFAGVGVIAVLLLAFVLIALGVLVWFFF